MEIRSARVMSKATLKFKLNEVEEMTQLDQLEQLIRTSSVTTIEKGPGPMEIMEMGPGPSVTQTMKTNRKWYKVISSVSAAVVIGLLLGLTIISMFIPSAEKSVIKPIQTAAPQTTVSEIAYALVQVGVFSTSQGANQTLQQLRTLGFTAAIDATNPNKQKVIAGIAADRDKAMLLSRLLQAKQVTSYVTPFALPARQTPKGAAFFTASQAFEQTVMTPLGQQLTTPSSKSITSNLVTTLKKKHAAWVTTARTIQANMTEPVRLGINTMSNEQLRLISSLESYVQNGQSAPLWQAQTALIRIILAEQRLRELY
jgi:hypothetical protein